MPGLNRMRSRVIGEVMGRGRTRRAVEVLYRERFPRFEQVARAIAGDRELGREAVQEGFILGNAHQVIGHLDIGTELREERARPLALTQEVFQR